MAIAQPSLFAGAAQATAPPLVMRDYQEECIAAILSAYDRGLRSVMAVLATGLGKTALVAELMRRLDIGPDNADACALFVAHRDELLRQGWKTVRRQIPGIQLGAEKADLRAVRTDQAVFASIATLRETRLLSLGLRLHGRIRLVVIDEAHRSAADHYRNLIAYIRETCPAALILGITATPDRTDKVGMADLYEEVVFHYDFADGIRNGYLVPLLGKRLRTNIELDGVDTDKRRGDLNEAQLAKYIDVEDRNRLVVDGIKTYMHDRVAVVFAGGVAHARRLADMLTDCGFEAAAVWGDTSTLPMKERIARISAFARGDLQYLVGADLFIEGADYPHVNGVVWGRATESTIIYSQGTGRGARPHTSIAHLLGPGTQPQQRIACIAGSAKPDTLVLDIVDVSKKHSLQSLPTLFGLQPRRARQPGIDDEQGDIFEVPEDLDGIVDFGDGEFVQSGIAKREPPKVRVVGVTVEDFDLMRAEQEVEAAVTDEGAKFHWHTPSSGVRRINFPDSDRAVDVQGKSVPGYGRAFMIAKGEGAEDPKAVALERVGAVAIKKAKLAAEIRPSGKQWVGAVIEDGMEQTICVAQRAGDVSRQVENWLRVHYPGLVKRYGKTASWRALAPSDKQIWKLKSLGLPVPLTRGEANDLLDKQLKKTSS